MKKFWKKYRVLIIVIAAAALLIAVGTLRKNTVDPHAGHDHATNPHTEQSQNADPHAGHDHSDYKAANSYTLKEDSNGRYMVQVLDAHGSTIFKRQNMLDKPTCTAVNEDILCVAGAGANPSTRWAIFCNVKQGTVSQSYSGCLATKGTNVAYGTNTDGAWQVHVGDAFDDGKTTYTLEGAYAIDNRSVISQAELNDQGDLVVTYWAGDVEKTQTIPMP